MSVFLFDPMNEFIVNLLIKSTFNNKIYLEEAAEKLNGMFLRDEQGRLVRVRIVLLS